MQRKISRGLTRRQVLPPDINDKIKTINIENGSINSLTSLRINADNIKAVNANIARIGIRYDPINDASYLHIPDNFSITSNDGNEIMSVNNGNATFQKINIADTIQSTDGRFIGNLEATNLSLLGDSTSTNSHVTNQLNVDGNFIGTSIRATTLNTTTMSATMGTFSNGLTTSGILVNGITETPQISSKVDLVLSVGPDHTINVPNIRYNVNPNNVHVIGPAEIKLSKIFIANGDVRLIADIACDGIEIAIFNNNVAEIRITGPQLITTIPQKTIKKFIYLALVQRWVN